MCTAISDSSFRHLFGRTLDLEHSYGESVTVTPRRFPLHFLHTHAPLSHPAFIGMAHLHHGIPYYYDAMNESGLSVAALNFPRDCVYRPVDPSRLNLASFEVIPWLLCCCDSTESAVAALKRVNITRDRAAASLPTTPLHFLIADRSAAVVLEATEAGITVYDDPFGVLTNSPPFPYHRTHLAEFLHLSSSPPENRLAPALPIPPYSRGMGACGLPGDYSSASRFVRAVFLKENTLPAHEPLAAVNRFFHLLDAVSLTSGAAKTENGDSIRTVYTSCMDSTDGIYYFTTYENRRIRAASMRDADLDSDTLTAFPLCDDADVHFISPANARKG